MNDENKKTNSGENQKTQKSDTEVSKTKKVKATKKAAQTGKKKESNPIQDKKESSGLKNFTQQCQEKSSCAFKRLSEAWEPYWGRMKCLGGGILIALLTCILLKVFVGNIFGFSDLFLSNIGGSGSSSSELHIGLGEHIFYTLGAAVLIVILLLSLALGCTIYLIAHFFVNSICYLFINRCDPKKALKDIRSFLLYFKSFHYSGDIRYVPYLFTYSFFNREDLRKSNVKRSTVYWQTAILWIVPIIFFI